MGDKLPTSTGELIGFQNHQQYRTYQETGTPGNPPVWRFSIHRCLLFGVRVSIGWSIFRPTKIILQKRGKQQIQATFFHHNFVPPRQLVDSP